MAFITLEQQGLFRPAELSFQKRQIENQAMQAAERQALAERAQAAQEQQFLIDTAVNQSQFGANLGDQQAARRDSIQQRLFELGFGEKAAQAGDTRSLAGQKEMLSAREQVTIDAEARKQAVEEQMLRDIASAQVAGEMGTADPHTAPASRGLADVGYLDAATAGKEAAQAFEASKKARTDAVASDLALKTKKSKLGLSDRAMTKPEAEVGGLPLSRVTVDPVTGKASYVYETPVTLNAVN